MPLEPNAVSQVRGALVGVDLQSPDKTDRLGQFRREEIGIVNSIQIYRPDPEKVHRRGDTGSQDQTGHQYFQDQKPSFVLQLSLASNSSPKGGAIVNL